MRAGDTVYRVGTGDGEVAVYSDEVVFGREDVPLGPIRISRDSLVAAANYANKELWLPDVVGVIFRNPEGRLEHLTWPLVDKGVCREVSDAIYRIIDRGFRKSFVGFLYTMTHRIDVRARF